MIKKVILIASFLILVISTDIFPQSRAENKMNFHDAESWILFEDYREALPLYQELKGIYPENSNFKYRIGQCFLNMPGEKEKAISYLEDAVKNINPEYREGSFRETQAPYDALYYLANAYRIDNQLDKAVSTYKLFMEKLDPEIYDTSVVAFQIQSCLNAKDLMSSPVYIREDNLGNNVNGSSSESNAVVSDDETMIVFSKSLPFYDAILYSTKVNGVWTEPRNMNELLKIDRNIYPASLSGDGRVLYLYNSENYDGNVFTTTYSNGTWSPVTRLNDNINTKFWESHAVVSHDNKKLYFTSNRKGTLGGLDIFVSRRDSTGDWGPAVNLGPVINTIYNEETPFLSRDDRTLFFSSRGHLNMGGHDIFYSSILNNGEWSVPLNAGYPLNSTDDDVFFVPLNQGYEGYFSKFSPSGFGRQDIYRLEIFSNKHPRKFMVRGVVKVADINLKTDDRIRISSVNTRNPDQISEDYADPETGEYELLVTNGDHTVTYETNGIERFRRDIHLPLTSKADSFIIPPTLLPKTDFTAHLDAGDENNFILSGRDTLTIPLVVEPNSLLTVEHWQGDSLLFSEQFNITDSTFNYKIAPQQGDRRIKFSLTDKYNNTSVEEITVSGGKITTRPLITRPEHPEVIAEKRAAAISELEKAAKDETARKETATEDVKTPATLPDEKSGKNGSLWYLWLIAGAGLFFLLIILLRKRNRDKEKK